MALTKERKSSSRSKGSTPAEHFGKKIVGRVTSPAIAEFPARTYDVIEVFDWADVGLPQGGKSYITNVWYLENNRIPLAVVEQFGATYTALSEELPSPPKYFRR